MCEIPSVEKPTCTYLLNKGLKKKIKKCYLRLVAILRPHESRNVKLNKEDQVTERGTFIESGTYCANFANSAILCL